MKIFQDVELLSEKIEIIKKYVRFNQISIFINILNFRCISAWYQLWLAREVLLWRIKETQIQPNGIESNRIPSDHLQIDPYWRRAADFSPSSQHSTRCAPRGNGDFGKSFEPHFEHGSDHGPSLNGWRTATIGSTARLTTKKSKIYLSQ